MSVNTSKVSLYKRSNHIRYIGYYASGQRRWKSTGCPTKCDAVAPVAHLQELLRQKPTPKRFSRFIEECLTHAAAVQAQGTVELHRRALNAWLEQVR